MTPDDEVTIDRRRGERRQDPEIVADETQSPETPTPERRKKVPRRRQIDPTTCERDYSEDEIEFMHALDEYKRANGRMFPTCSEILEVVRDLGYAKIEKQLASDQQVAESASSGTATDVVAEDITTPPDSSVPQESVPQESDALGLPIAELPEDSPSFTDNYTF